MSLNIYSYGEEPKVIRSAICTKCRKIQHFDAPSDWRPECCAGFQTATTVDLFKTLGKVPGGKLPSELETIKTSLTQLLKLVTDAEDAEILKNSVETT